MSRAKKSIEGKSAVTLQTIAQYVGLAPCSISAVLNDSPAARRIPQQTKNRVMRAAVKLNYRPNFSARSLRTRRTHLVAVVASDLRSARVSRMICEVERYLRENGYLLVLGGAERGRKLDATARVLRAGVEGVIVIDEATEGTSVVPVIHLSTRDLSGDISVERLEEVAAKAARAIVLQIESREEGSGDRTRVNSRRATQSIVRARAGAA